MRFPNVFGAPVPVTPPTLNWQYGQAPPPDAANEYQVASIVSDAAVRATLQGGTIPAHAHEIAAEQGLKLDPSRVFP